MPRKPKTEETQNTAPAAAKRGRKMAATAVQHGPEFVGATPPAMAEPEARMSQAAGAYSADRDLMNQILGQIQMAEAISKFTTVVGLTKMAHIKETKLYRALAGKKGTDQDGNEIPDVGTWDGFCRATGSSANKVDEDLLNLRAFGEDAMRQLSSIGAGYRDLRKLRALPDDTRTALLDSPEAKQALASGDKDALRELIDDMAAAHQRERDKNDKCITDLKARVGGLEVLSTEKSKKIAALEMNSDSALELRWPEIISVRKGDVHALSDFADKALSSCLKLVNKTRQEADELEVGSEEFAAYKTVIHPLGELIERICTAAALVRAEFDTHLGGFIEMDKTHVLDDAGVSASRTSH